MNIADSSRTDATPARAEETVLLEWTVHLLRRQPRRAVAVLGAMALAALCGLLLFHSLLLAVVGVALLFSSTAEFLLPIRYRLTSERACAAWGASRLEIAWANVRRAVPANGSVKLSPLGEESRLEAFRGVLLRFAENREAVMGLVEERMAGRGRE